jgi:hypothetical protein
MTVQSSASHATKLSHQAQCSVANVKNYVVVTVSRETTVRFHVDVATKFHNLF